MKFVFLFLSALTVGAAFQLVGVRHADASEITKLCDGYFDVVSGDCLKCPGGYKIDITKSAGSRELCYRTAKKKAKYSYNTGSILKACKHGTFANVGSTKCHKCPRHYHHDITKKVDEKGVCFRHERKGAKSRLDVVHMLMERAKKDLKKCDKSVDHLLPSMPIKAFDKSFYDGKLKVKVDGKFGKSYVEGFACEFPSQFVDNFGKFLSLKHVSAKELIHHFDSDPCKKISDIGVRAICAAWQPLEHKLKACWKAFDPLAYVDFSKAVFKAAKQETLTFDLNAIAKQEGEQTAAALTGYAATGVYLAKKKAEKQVKIVLEKLGVPKSVIKTLAKSKDVIDAYQYANKGLATCKL